MAVTVRTADFKRAFAAVYRNRGDRYSTQISRNVYVDMGPHTMGLMVAKAPCAVIACLPAEGEMESEHWAIDVQELKEALRHVESKYLTLVEDDVHILLNGHSVKRQFADTFLKFIPSELLSFFPTTEPHVFLQVPNKELVAAIKEVQEKAKEARAHYSDYMELTLFPNGFLYKVPEWKEYPLANTRILSALLMSQSMPKYPPVLTIAYYDNRGDKVLPVLVEGVHGDVHLSMWLMPADATPVSASRYDGPAVAYVN